MRLTLGKEETIPPITIPNKNNISNTQIKRNNLQNSTRRYSLEWSMSTFLNRLFVASEGAPSNKIYPIDLKRLSGQAP